jgi:hypothetical protein
MKYNTFEGERNNNLMERGREGERERGREGERERGRVLNASEQKTSNFVQFRLFNNFSFSRVCRISVIKEKSKMHLKTYLKNKFKNSILQKSRFLGHCSVSLEAGLQFWFYVFWPKTILPIGL